MTVQTTTKKALETAHQAADDILDGASDAVQSARDMANRSLDKADSRIHHLRQDVDPRIDDIAAKAQDLASRGIAYCVNTSDRARRQLRQAADTTTRYVAEKPGTSLLIAAAAGAAFATAVMLARRSGERH